ncbi:Predicted transcriptional regulator [Ruminococcaceae bacterium KH2T8]|nr:Predicted transcriptional regulator [Ruminococcaceae bacterium KH2T8]
MEELFLSDSEYRLMDIIWANAPLESGKLVKLAEEKLSWKKSTTYTILRKLITKGMALNEDTVVKVIVERDRVQRFESSRVVKRNFGGSLPSFITAFLGDKTLSGSEADELIELIDSYRDDK